VATMAFALFVLGSGVPEAERVFNIAAVCVLASIVAHGLTDHAGSEWISRREAAQIRVSG
jgi:sodium/hydrogen antiporter